MMLWILGGHLTDLLRARTNSIQPSSLKEPQLGTLKNHQ